MSKRVLVAIATMAAATLVAGTAFAAGQLNAGNTTLAAEKIPASTSTVYAAGNVNTAYQTGGPIAASTVLKISLTNGTFANTTAIAPTFAICNGTNAVTNTTAYSSATNASSVLVTVASPLATGTVYTLQTGAACVAAAPLTVIQVPGGSTAGTVLGMTIDSNTSPGDANVLANATVLTVKNQFSATLAPVTSTVSFTSGLKQLVADAAVNPPNTTAATTANAGFLMLSDETINDKVVAAGGTAAACDASLSATDALTIKTSGNLSGIASFALNGGAAQGVVAADITAGFKSFDAVGAAGAAAAGNLFYCDASVNNTNKALTMNVDGTTALNARTLTSQVTLKSTGAGSSLAAGYSRDLIAAGSNAFILQLGATQYYLGLVKTDAANGTETYVKLQSKSNTTGSNGVLVSVLAADGTTVDFNAGTITAGTPFTVTGAEMKTAVEAAGKTVPANGFAAIISVNAAEADVFGYANIVDPTGAKRLPLKTVAGTIVE